MSTRAGVAALAAAAWLVVFGCAPSPPTPPTRTVLAGDGAHGVVEQLPEPDRETLGPKAAISLPFRGPDPSGTAYRLVVEMSGETSVVRSSDVEASDPFGESHLIELEFTERPTGGADDAYLLVLDALHYQLVQRNPDARRELEIGDDRFRMFSDGKEVLDLRGAQPKEDLTPRILLEKVFAVVVHDAMGNPLSIAPRGTPASRRFMKALPVRRAIGYSRWALPSDPIEPGSAWTAQRFPVSPTGELGLALTVEYSLAGFEEVDGVACALIALRAEKSGEDVPSEAGFSFDRVRAKLDGLLWVALATSRLQRLELEDEIRAAFTRGPEDASITTRVRHATRLVLEPRYPGEDTKLWADGSERFGRR